MLVLIGLDSVSRPLIDELVAEGRMPSFAGLRERGTLVPLETPGTHFTASSFPSLWTGVEVHDHGLYYPFLWSPEEQRVIVGTHRPSPPSIWEAAHRAGRRVLVIDPYEGRRPSAETPTCLSGVQFHNRVVLERWGSPPGALEEWERRIGRGRPAQEVFGQQSERRLTSLTQTLLGASERAANLVEIALATERPDLLVVMFPAVHLAGHQLWDPASVLPGARLEGALATGLRDVYASADRAIGRVLDALPADADVILFSVLGMSTNMSRNDLLPEMLGAVLSGGADRTNTSSAWRMRATLPTGLRAAVANALPDALALELAARSELRGTNWASTRAFSVPSDAQGLIRINLKGRERAGIVEAQDVDGLLDELSDGLSSFVDDDGRSVVAEVVKTREVIPAGAMSDALPDLIVHWAVTDTLPTGAVASPRFGVIAPTGVGTGRSGNHTDDAWALVAPGRSRLRSPARSFRVTDLAHTALVACDAGSGGEPLLDMAGG